MAESTLEYRILEQAEIDLTEEPITITSYSCERSAGGRHDFFSEGDYWWPDPENPEGPYIQRDGLTNPENFTAHREAMIRFSMIVGNLASAYKITGDEKYMKQAMVHMKAWFVDTASIMNPSLLYVQAIKGKVTGRGIGIIDAIQLMEVAQSLVLFEKSAAIDKKLDADIKLWFSRLLQWLFTHPYGIDEMNAKNNHGVCYVMQTAVFARLTGNDSILNFCSGRFKNLILPLQMADDGSLPLELKRTKPYGYSLFTLDAMATIAQVLSDEKDNLWKYVSPEGKSLEKGIQYLYPFVKNKKLWPFKQDVMYWENWPVAQPFLLFAAVAYQNNEYYKTWKNLEHFPTTPEVLRNLPVRNPLIWMN